MFFLIAIFVPFVFAQGDDLCVNSSIPCGDDLILYGENYEISSEDNTIIFHGDFTINDNVFENIDAEGSNVVVDLATGEILEADYYVKEGETGTYNINGIKFDVFLTSQVKYSLKDNFLELGQSSRINEIPEEVLEKGISIKGKKISYKDLDFINGESIIDKKGYLIQEGNILGDNKKYIGENLYVSHRSADLVDFSDHYKSGSGENFVQRTEREGVIKGISLTTAKGRNSAIIEFLEGDSLLKVGEGETFSVECLGGDMINIYQSSEGVPAVIYHGESDYGITIFKNGGWHNFLARKEGFYKLPTQKNPGDPVDMVIFKDNSRHQSGTWGYEDFDYGPKETLGLVMKADQGVKFFSMNQEVFKVDYDELYVPYIKYPDGHPILEPFDKIESIVVLNIDSEEIIHEIDEYKEIRERINKK